jgi:hypothetical protein
MWALNFYSDLYADMLRRGRKTATIRLGDKSDKYQSGEVVLVTVGRRFGPRQKVFLAIIDQVDVKKIGDLSNIEVEKENPEFRSPEDVMTLLSRIYDKLVTPMDLVTVVQFSPIWEEGRASGADLDMWFT